MNKQTIRVTALKQSDITKVAKLYETSLRDNQKGFIQINDFNESIKSMANEFKANNGNVYILKENNRVLGMGALKKVDNITVEICKLHLYPQLKGRGLGKKMALELMEYAKKLGYTKMNLHVTKTQREAIGLYTRLGFDTFKEKLCTLKRDGKILKFDTLYMERELELDALVECA